jgi:hypothetical protein
MEPTEAVGADRGGWSGPRRLEPTPTDGADHDRWSRPRQMEPAEAVGVARGSNRLNRLQASWPTPSLALPVDEKKVVHKFPRL